MQPYSAAMLSHFQSPRNSGALPDPDIIGRGDLDGRPPRTEIYAKFDGNVIHQTGFTTFGCGASIASASALTQLISGQPIDFCRRIEVRDILTALDGLPTEKEFCAAIAIAALQDLIRQWYVRSRT
ncbi:MAG TPA: iron-sulfur cluster assembly scaffold protein [Pirellulales bacterium]|jgi:nitrogen fixation NifU-like protein